MLENQTQPNPTPSTGEISYQQKLYRTLKTIDAELISEYMESFGLDPERAKVGQYFKEATEQMSEAEFVEFLDKREFQGIQLDPVELDVIYGAASEGVTDDTEC